MQFPNSSSNPSSKSNLNSNYESSPFRISYVKHLQSLKFAFLTTTNFKISTVFISSKSKSSKFKCRISKQNIQIHKAIPNSNLQNPKFCIPCPNAKFYIPYPYSNFCLISKFKIWMLTPSLKTRRPNFEMPNFHTTSKFKMPYFYVNSYNNAMSQILHQPLSSQNPQNHLQNISKWI